MKYVNPFPIIDYESPKFFCNREKELIALKNAFNNNRNLTLISIRRLGKTSLIKHLFYHLSKASVSNVKLLYFDILKTQNLSEFVKELSNKIVEIEAKNANWLKKLSKLLSGIKANISINENSGTPSIQLGYQTAQESELSLDKIFQYLASQKETYLIAIDEFQQITQYPELNIEAILRTHIQHQHKDRFIFSGSSKHILVSMFNDYGRPFYQSTELLNLERLELNEYSNFIKSKFEDNNRQIDIELIVEIIKYLDLHTFYVQYFFNKLYETQIDTIDKEVCDKLITNILLEKEYVYMNYKNILTSLQFDLLKAIAKEQVLEKPNASEFIRKYNFTQASSVNKTLKALLSKEMVYKENGIYKVYDVFLSKWLEQN